MRTNSVFRWLQQILVKLPMIAKKENAVSRISCSEVRHAGSC